MGCSTSKADESSLVLLCRDRRDLIRAAAVNRYALAGAHAAYFRSLAAVGDALHRFVADELAVAPSPPSSHEGKHAAASSSSFSITPLSHSLSPEGSHLHLSSPSDHDAEDQVDRRTQDSPQRMFSVPSPNYYYARSSPAIPPVVNEEPYGYGYGYGFDAYYNGIPSRVEAVATPPPPPAEGTAWDYFNPFYDSYEQNLPGYYYQGAYGVGSGMSSPNSSEVREREGIPDLEEDMEMEPLREVRKGKKKVVDEDVGTSKGWEKDIKSGSSGIGKKTSSSSGKVSKDSSLERDMMSNGEEEVGGFHGESSMVREESSGSDGNPLSTQGTRDVMEVVDEIKQQFKFAADFGDEVARILEVGRLPYQPGCGMLTVVYSRILDLVALRPSTSSHPSLKCQRLSRARRLKNKISYADYEKYVGLESGNLSSTLEKLYMWEKKLYKEVKDEEKLRIMYNKKWRQLRALDFRGAESHKIDSIRESIRKLSTKISVVFKKIDAISSRVHKIRDEELQPQLIELIHGLIRMWKHVLDCHQKQFQALIDSKSHKLIARTDVERDSVAKATVELKMELLNWCSCFNDWICTQKTYIGALNGWLMKWLVQEQEITPDGVVPFSPSSVGAPAAFIISNDWDQAMKNIPQVEVTQAMHSFADSLHEMWESQKKEQQQKLKAEYLSRDFETRLKTLQKDAALTTDDGAGNDNTPMLALEPLKKRLEEERTKHEETLKHIQDVASSCLGTGLLPVFDALRNFTLETVKAYEELRIPNKGGRT